MARIVTVFGGSGFIGRHLVKRLAADGDEVRVAVRDAEAANFLKTAGEAGQIVLWPTDIREPDQVATALDGADAAVNLVGILSEWGRRTFEAVHVDGARVIAEAASTAGVARLLHVSAIGADAASASRYAQTKAAGEEAVGAAFAGATIVRPSVVFGPEDSFFNMFAGLTRLTPMLPVFGCPTFPKASISVEQGRIDVDVELYGDGGTRFQPVYVGDVADAIMAALADDATRGKVYELGGPTVYSFKELMELMLEQIGRRRLLIPVAFGLAVVPAWFLEKLPQPPLTRDQLELMKSDNVVSDQALGLNDLGVEAHSAEAILPTYLHRFRPPVRQGSKPV